MIYSIEKPMFGLWTKALFGVVFLGLIGLGIVAYETFILFHKPVVAVAFALIIELGAVTEAIGLANGISKKTWWVIPGLLITLLVSGGYNYLSVTRAGELLTPKVTDPLILAAIGIGPLSSIFFMSIGLGFKLREHEEELKQWGTNLQVWEDEQRDKQVQIRLDVQKKEQEARERQLQINAQLEYQKRKAQLEAEERLRLAEITSKERNERREAALKAKEISARAHEEALKFHEAKTEASDELQRGKYEDFLNAMKQNGDHEWTANEIASTFHVTERTGFTWLAKYKQENLNPISIGRN